MKKLLLFIIILLMCIGCNPSQKINIKSVVGVYLVEGNEGYLSEDDLKKHPEVVVVHSFSELKEIVKTEEVAVLIDENAVNMVERDWFTIFPQVYCPTVLVGNGNVQTSFNTLGGFSIHGAVERDMTRKEGFSVWKLFKKTDKETSAFFTGYTEPITVKNILDKTTALTKGKNPNVRQNILDPNEVVSITTEGGVPNTKRITITPQKDKVIIEKIIKMLNTSSEKRASNEEEIESLQHGYPVSFVIELKNGNKLKITRAMQLIKKKSNGIEIKEKTYTDRFVLHNEKGFSTLYSKDMIMYLLNGINVDIKNGD